MIFDSLNGYNEDIVEENDNGVEKRIRYFFTPLNGFIKKDGKSGKRRQRKAGPGSWKEECCDPIELQPGGDLVGSMKYFRYKLDKNKNGDGLCIDNDGIEWRMHEFSLLGTQDWAICRITKVVCNKKKAKCSSRSIKIVLPVVVQQQEPLVKNTVLEQSVEDHNTSFNSEEVLATPEDGSLLTDQELMELLDFDSNEQDQLFLADDTLC